MWISDETIEKIDKENHKIWKSAEYRNGSLGLDIVNDGHIISNGHALCYIQELSKAILELQFLREAISNTTGIEY